MYMYIQTTTANTRTFTTWTCNYTTPLTYLLPNSPKEIQFPNLTIATHWLSVYSDMGRQYSKENTKWSGLFTYMPLIWCSLCFNLWLYSVCFATGTYSVFGLLAYVISKSQSFMSSIQILLSPLVSFYVCFHYTQFNSLRSVMMTVITHMIFIRVCKSN
jgi:hypothetical protein